MSALDSVTSPAGTGNTPTEKAISIHIPRKYPQAPEGIHRAICVSAEVREVQEDTEFAKKGDKRIHFGWEIQDEIYADEEGVERKYRVWSKPMTMMFKAGKGKTPNLVALMMKLTGFPPYTQKTKVTVDIGNGVMRTFDADVFDQEMVTNMECSLVIQHNEWNGEMRAGIESYSTTDVQRKKNWLLLTPEARAAYANTAAIVEPIAVQGGAIIAPRPVPTAENTIVGGSHKVPDIPSIGSSVEMAREMIKGAKTASEFASLSTIVLDGMNPEELAQLSPDIEEAKKRCGA